MRVYNTRNSIGFKNFLTKRIRFGNSSSIKVSLTDYQKLSKLISDFNTNKNSIISFIEDLVNRDPYNNGHIIFDADISGIKDIKNVIDSCGNILLSNLQSFNNDYKLYTNDRIKYLYNPDNFEDGWKKLFEDAIIKYKDVVDKMKDLHRNLINIYNSDTSNEAQYEKAVIDSITAYNNYINVNISDDMLDTFKNPDNFQQLMDLIDNVIVVALKGKSDSEIIIFSLQNVKDDLDNDITGALENYEKTILNSINDFNNYITDNNITYISKIE